MSKMSWTGSVSGFYRVGAYYSEKSKMEEKERLNEKRRYNQHVRKVKMFIGTQEKLAELNNEVSEFLESVNGTVVYTDTKREKDGTIILTVTYAIYPNR